VIRAVVDEVVPTDFVALCRDSEIEVAAFPGEWRSLSDGEVINAASLAGFDWLLTCDKQMPFQQNLSGRPLAVMVLPTPQIPELKRIRSALLTALAAPAPGNFVILGRDGEQEGKPAPHLIGRKRKQA
jgi:hypothetical protein